MSQRFKAYADICFTTADIKPWWASPLMTCINESPQQCFTPMKIYSNELPQGLPHHVGLTTTQTAKNQVYVSVIITIHDPQHNNAQLGHWSRKLYLRHYSAHWKNTWIYQGGCRPSRPPPSGLDSMASSIWHVMSHMSFLLYHFSCHCYQIPIYIYTYIRFVFWHVSCLKTHFPYCIYHASLFNSRVRGVMFCFACHMSYVSLTMFEYHVPCYISRVSCLKSHTTCPMSHLRICMFDVTCTSSHVVCHVSFCHVLGLVWALVGHLLNNCLRLREALWHSCWTLVEHWLDILGTPCRTLLERPISNTFRTLCVHLLYTCSTRCVHLLYKCWTLFKHCLETCTIQRTQLIKIQPPNN